MFPGFLLVNEPSMTWQIVSEAIQAEAGNIYSRIRENRDESRSDELNEVKKFSTVG